MDVDMRYGDFKELTPSSSVRDSLLRLPWCTFDIK